MFRHIYYRQDYPREGGYRLTPKPLPDWVHLEVKEEGGSQVLYVHSRLHVNKVSKVGPSYSKEFTPIEIVKDLSGEVARRFL